MRLDTQPLELELALRLSPGALCSTPLLLGPDPPAQHRLQPRCPPASIKRTNYKAPARRAGKTTTTTTHLYTIYIGRTRPPNCATPALKGLEAKGRLDGREHARRATLNSGRDGSGEILTRGCFCSRYRPRRRAGRRANGAVACKKLAVNVSARRSTLQEDERTREHGRRRSSALSCEPRS